MGSDGFVSARFSGGSSDYLRGYTSDNATPTLKQGFDFLRTASDSGLLKENSLLLPVRKDEYWKITCSKTPVIEWRPLGSGTCVKQA